MITLQQQAYHFREHDNGELSYTREDLLEGFRNHAVGYAPQEVEEGSDGEILEELGKIGYLLDADGTYYLDR